MMVKISYDHNSLHTLKYVDSFFSMRKYMKDMIKENILLTYNPVIGLFVFTSTRP